MSVLYQNFAKTVQKRLFSSAGYSSALSLDKLYPNSSLKLSTPAPPPVNPNEKFNGFIPIEQLDITYSRSSGPGGQNVNKVNTKVEVKFNLEKASWINAAIKPKLAEKYKNRLTNDGNFIFRSDLTRFQHLNLADCLEKIRVMIRDSSVEPHLPSEETLERIRKRHEKACVERLATKRGRSQDSAQRSAISRRTRQRLTKMAASAAPA